jgi:hypothetical protein
MEVLLFLLATKLKFSEALGFQFLVEALFLADLLVQDISSDVNSLYYLVDCSCWENIS